VRLRLGIRRPDADDHIRSRRLPGPRTVLRRRVDAWRHGGIATIHAGGSRCSPMPFRPSPTSERCRGGTGGMAVGPGPSSRPRGVVASASRWARLVSETGHLVQATDGSAGLAARKQGLRVGGVLGEVAPGLVEV
jgi:hypothetical protein